MMAAVLKMTVLVNVVDQQLKMNAAFVMVMALLMAHVTVLVMLMPVVVAAKLVLLAVIILVVQH